MNESIFSIVKKCALFGLLMILFPGCFNTAEPGSVEIPKNLADAEGLDGNHDPVKGRLMNAKDIRVTRSSIPGIVGSEAILFECPPGTVQIDDSNEDLNLDFVFLSDTDVANLQHPNAEIIKGTYIDTAEIFEDGSCRAMARVSSTKQVAAVLSNSDNPQIGTGTIDPESSQIEPLEGDYDGDGCITYIDYLIWTIRFQTVDPESGEQYDIGDYTTMMDSYEISENCPERPWKLDHSCDLDLDRSGIVNESDKHIIWLNFMAYFYTDNFNPEISIVLDRDGDGVNQDDLDNWYAAYENEVGVCPEILEKYGL